MASQDRSRNRTFRNLVGSLAACAVLVAAVGLLSWRPHREAQVQAVDYTAALAQARAAAPWVLAPTPMPAGWQATSAYAGQEPVSWHLGVITADKQYVGLEQAAAAPTRFVPDKLGETTEDGTTTVAGATWQRRILVGKDERAIVRSAGGVTTIVTGTTGYDVLQTFAATLR